jgi:uncharacterized protein YkwD
MPDIRAIFIFLFSICLLGIRTSPAVYAQKHKEVKSVRSMTSEILSLVNKYRAESDLPPLILDERICRAAKVHSENMAKGKVSFGHAGFDARVGGLLKELAPANSGAENVAFSPKGAGSVVQGWMKSTGHRKNIEGDYNYTGIGIAESKNGYHYVTMIYIRKK